MKNETITPSPLLVVGLNRKVMPLPCPFCGATDIAVEESDTFRWRVAKCNCCGAQAGDVRIQTAGSGTKEEWEARAVDAAITEWNKRHNIPINRQADLGRPNGD